MHKSVSTWDFISLIGPHSDISVSLLLDMKDFFTVAIWNECEGNYWSLSCYGGRISKGETTRDFYVALPLVQFGSGCCDGRKDTRNAGIVA